MLRNKLTKLAVGILAAALLLPAAATSAFGAEKLEGSWVETDFRENGTFISLLTFTRDANELPLHGEVTETYFNPAVALQPSGHGVWRKIGEGRYDITFDFLDPTGTFVGACMDQTIQVNDAGDRYRGNFQTQIMDANGRVIETVTGTVKAELIHVESSAIDSPDGSGT